MDDLLDVGVGKRVTFSSAENLVVSPSPEHDANLPPPPQQQQAEKWGTAVEGRKERKASLPDNAMVIQELDSSPPLKRRLPSAGEVGGKENGGGGGEEEFSCSEAHIWCIITHAAFSWYTIAPCAHMHTCTLQ